MAANLHTPQAPSPPLIPPPTPLPVLSSSYSRSGLMDVRLQLSLHLIIGKECLVARMGDSQSVPVLQQGGPGLKKPVVCVCTCMCACMCVYKEVEWLVYMHTCIWSKGKSCRAPGKDVKLKHRDVVIDSEIDG